MNTPSKEKELTKSSIDKAVFVRAMTEMLMNMNPDQIKIPTKFRDQVLTVKDLLKQDTSGMANSLIDFAITSALVDYSVETNNPELNKMFDEWMADINSELVGKIPTGLTSLAKEYFRERWKGSSFIILRSVWEERNGFILPTKLWFVNGEDIVISSPDETFSIGQEKYSLKINKKDTKNIPAGKDERIFVQKPFESWGTEYPVPFLIRRGLYKNLRLLDILATKGEYVVGKALEYLLVLKKGTENLALANQAEFVYSAEDLKAIKTQMEEVLTQRKSIPGTPTYATNFDTDIQHLIPDYAMALKQELFTPIERRIMAGLGLIDVLQGVASTRKETMMNPRPFIAEVESGISDFKQLLGDVLQTIIQLNKAKHPKHVGKISHIHSTPISQFMTDKLQDNLRDMYDRGVLSKRTYAEIVGQVDFDIELDRRKDENDKKIEKVMTVPILPDKNVPEPKLPPVVPEKKTIVEKPVVKDKKVTKEKANLDDSGLTKSAQDIWINTYNKYVNDKGEEFATKVAWTVISKLYKAYDGKWVKKTKKELQESNINSAESILSFNFSESELIDVAQLDIQLKEAQLKMVNKLLEENK